MRIFFSQKRDYLFPRNYYRPIKHYYQRCRYGVSFVDEWSLDYYIAHILIHALPKYKNTSAKYAYCRVLDDDAALTFGEGKQNKKELKKAYKRYDAMVDSIVVGLKTIDTSYHDEAADAAFELYGKNARRFWW